MLKLFKYESYQVKIEPEALTLKPFKELWIRDKSKDKNRAMQELAYVYFMEDTRSDYQMYLDRDERSRQIKIGEGLPEDWKPDKQVIAAQTFYASFKSESALLLEDIRTAINTLRKGMITQEELSDIDPEKKPTVLKNYAGVIETLTGLAAKVDEVEKKMSKETVSSDKVRGSIEKAMFEDDL